ncbi:cytochrome c oxidase assembly protein [Thioalkalivibrio sp. ARh3]|uniref:cytochrome c oxidase assembly protein n=1 Tax=Thioalkalivibrio sp. ARh3 TaxID=1158148 RepID=UPI00037C6507|nr:cytochrome c oxidase assembly protein [Thioalkalivibrio sp. ARh3]
MSLSRAAIALLVGITLLAMAGPALAHSPFTGDTQERLAAWLTAALLGVFWLLYVVGMRRIPPERWRNVLFHSVALLGALTLLGPLDDWAKTGTAPHMAQHMLLMVVIAPLWVLSRPLPQLIAAAPGLYHILWGPLLRIVRYPLACAWVHAVAIWFWHTPRFYMIAVDDPWWHALEHASFLLTAGVFWWAVLRGAPRHAPWVLLALLFTLMHTGFLGAVLAFARAPLYGEARSLVDQQLAGLIMWVPGAIPYLLATAWVAYLWYRRLVRRMA